VTRSKRNSCVLAPASTCQISTGEKRGEIHQNPTSGQEPNLKMGVSAVSSFPNERLDESMNQVPAATGESHRVVSLESGG